MLHKNRQCIDAGTAACPCRLAEYGQCLVCSRLGAGMTDHMASGPQSGPCGLCGPAGSCDCQWQGVCIYNEYLQNNRCIKEKRESALYKIEKITWYEEDLVVMRLAIPRGMAERAALPGSFVFIKQPSDEQYFDTPISVLRSSCEEGYMDLAVKISGIKTRRLAESDPEWMEVRGLYSNGLLGAEKLMTAGRCRVLCLAKGLGLAPLANYARWAEGLDKIDFIIDTEKITERFAEDCISDCILNSVEYGRLPHEITWAQQEQYDVIIIGASDYYQQNIYVPEGKRVVTNNCSMCCGEGICGACIHTDKKGRGHRMCKCTKLIL